MKKLGKAAVLLAAAAVLSSLSGCWNYHELENYSIVSGIAVDVGQNGYQYHLTFECVDLSDEGDTGGVQPLIMESDGNSIFDAVRSVLRESDKKLYFTHCQVILLGNAIAEQGVRPVLDWFLRDAEPRATLEFLVSRAATAGEILRVKPKSGQITAFQISKTLAEDTSFYGSSPTVQLYQMNNTLNSDGISLTLPAIELKKTKSGDSVQLAGLAVFRGDRQIGWLDDLSSKYFAFVRGRVTGGVLLTGEKPDGDSLALEIMRSKTDIKPEVSGGRAAIRIEVHLLAAAAEQNDTGDILTKSGFEQVERYAERTLEEGIANVVRLVQERYGSDIFGFGNVIYKDEPDEWERLKPRWNDAFRSLPVEVSADVTIQNSSRLVPKGGG